jgi:hypothetical protein
MKTILLVLAMVIMATTAMAGNEVCTHIWPSGNVEYYQCGTQPICPSQPIFSPCPVCRPVTVTCKCERMQLEGLFKVNIGGVMRCGVITVMANGFLLEENLGQPIGNIPREIGDVFFLSNAWKRLEKVQYCD